MPRVTLDRRTFLRAAGVALALPALESMLPTRAIAAGSGVAAPKRILAINSPLGIHREFMYPQQAGTNFEATPYLQPLEELRGHYTIFSGLQHPGVDGGHAAESSFLTAASHPGSSSFRNSISLDQFAAESIGHLTRFPSLPLGIDGGNGLSWSRDGVQIPVENSPAKLFERLFFEGSESEREKQVARLRDGQSIMDLVVDQTKGIERRIGQRDRQTLDQYVTAVRDLENRLHRGEEWAHKPKPQVAMQPPQDISDRANFVARTRLMYDIIHLAFQTDSTRLVTLQGAGGNAVPLVPGVEEGWHNLSHHGKDAGKLEQLKRVETEEFKALAYLAKKLQDSHEDGETLLDRTSIFFGSNLGDANAHHNRNLPAILIGGKYHHGQHLVFEESHAPPLANVFVSMLQHTGIEADSFASGKSTLTELS